MDLKAKKVMESLLSKELEELSKEFILPPTQYRGRTLGLVRKSVIYNVFFSSI
ncbi:hypothetical protein [Peribacillus cavernae]|uniref:hypothetical protein n=1 Tax=Peribacillus cavernae TaxID=1674310 RepID=UPI00163C164C|nr:hypothetical protein [Peribacillus cavernae]MDQ0219269.1 hypothetical protein [Peribacillus cavernae]